MGTTPRSSFDLYDLLAQAAPAPAPAPDPDARPQPQTTITASVETIDNDREATGAYPCAVPVV